MNKKTQSDKTTYTHKDTGEVIDMNQIKERVFKELQKSNFKLDKNNIPLSYKDELYEGTARIEQRMIEEFPARMKDALYDTLKEQGIADDEMDWALAELMKHIAPRFREIIEKAYGMKWVEFSRDITDNMNSMNLDSDFKMHYETLEECSADYVLKTENGEYKKYRIAWKDAVDKGFTYTNKYGDKVKLNHWKQLERALGRIKDNNDVERYGLEKIFPKHI